MPAQIKVYRLKEFLRINETGIIDVKRSKELIRQLAAASGIREIDNMLIDLRDTTIDGVDMADVLDIAAEFGRYNSAFRGKIANIIPGDGPRFSVARQIKTFIGLHCCKYEIFTTFEDAIDWLSEIEC